MTLPLQLLDRMDPKALASWAADCASTALPNYAEVYPETAPVLQDAIYAATSFSFDPDEKWARVEKANAAVSVLCDEANVEDDDDATDAADAAWCASMAVAATTNVILESPGWAAHCAATNAADSLCYSGTEMRAEIEQR